jgi:hypothetical protein
VHGHLRLPGNSPPRLQELQQAQLCAACHALHEFAGRPAALLTNHEQALLLLVTAVGGPESVAAAPVPRRCTALPFRTVEVQPLSPALRAFVAAGNLALAAAKLDDDVDDGGGLLARFGRFVLSRPARRARARLAALGFPVSRLAGLRERQRAVERAPGASIDALAAPTAELLAQVFAHGAMLGERGADAEAFADFGRAIGRIVYGIDALQDQVVDARRGRFNAVAALAVRHGAAAPALVLGFVASAVTDARQALAGRLQPERAELLTALLDAAVRSAQAAVPERGTMVRSAEAGDCDLPCDTCCEVPDCGPPASCDGVWCVDLPCCDRGRRRRRRQSPRAESDRGAARSARRDLELLFGHAGVAVTELAPVGIIRIGVTEHDAMVLRGAIAAGTPVRVVDVQGERLVVVIDTRPADLAARRP